MAKREWEKPRYLPGEIKMQQICIGQFVTEEGIGSYSVIGLSKDGKVYRYDAGCSGWFPWNMKVVTCEHRR